MLVNHPLRAALWAAVCLLAACSGSRSTKEAVSAETDYSTIRGANYTPTYASTSIATWKNFDSQVIDRELGYAERLNLNSVRVFLQYVVYEHDPQQFLEHLDTFVDRADRRGIRPMFVLFDSCFGDEPSFEKDQSPTWLNNPGFSRIASDDWSGLEKYVADIVGRFRGDARVLMWDIMNEPMADFHHVTTEERNRIWRFVRHFCDFVKENDPTHPITVGHAVVEYIPKTMDRVDALSIHSYLAYEDWFQADIDLALEYGRQAGKPVIFTEFGNPGAGQTYEMTFDVIDRNNLGFYFWELTIGKIQFVAESGLIYPDGTVRQPAAVAALMGFQEKEEGGIPIKDPPDWSPVKELLDNKDRWLSFLDEAEQIPRTREAIMGHLYRVGMLGRHAARPDIEAQKVFENGLSLAQWFRMGEQDKAVAAYEEMLRLTRRAVEERLEEIAAGG